MKLLMKAVLSGLWCLFTVPGLIYSEPAVEPQPVVYYNGFETPADCASNNSGCASCQPMLIQRRIDAAEAMEGKASLLEEFRVRKDGFFYPVFPLPRPVRLEDGPLYLSGYVKIIEQHPEANHSLLLGCMGQFPRKTSGYKGFEFRAPNSVDLTNGWTYFYSNDLRQDIGDLARKNGTPFEDACVTSIYLQFWGMRPGEVLSYRVDNLRLTRFNPVPVPDAETYRQALALYQQMTSDKINFNKFDESLFTAFASGLSEAEQIVQGNGNEPGEIKNAKLVGKVREIEKIYWHLKLLQLAEE